MWCSSSLGLAWVLATPVTVGKCGELELINVWAFILSEHILVCISIERLYVFEVKQNIYLCINLLSPYSLISLCVWTRESVTIDDTTTRNHMYCWVMIDWLLLTFWFVWKCLLQYCFAKKMMGKFCRIIKISSIIYVGICISKCWL